jgi:hypothetical protein
MHYEPIRSDHLCECGCGERTYVVRNNEPTRGIKRGEPRRFLPGHNRRRSAEPYDVDERGCWIWKRSLDGAGYGKAWDPATKRLTVAHRLFYELANGPIPDGLHIDHRCRNKRCVNPGHLEAVTVTENNHRAFFGRRVDGTFMREDESA